MPWNEEVRQKMYVLGNSLLFDINIKVWNKILTFIIVSSTKYTGSQPHGPPVRVGAVSQRWT